MSSLAVSALQDDRCVHVTGCETQNVVKTLRHVCKRDGYLLSGHA